jgi:hypothetical protein
MCGFNNVRVFLARAMGNDALDRSGVPRRKGQLKEEQVLPNVRLDVVTPIAEHLEERLMEFHFWGFVCDGGWGVVVDSGG